MQNPPEHLKTLLWEYDIDSLDIDHPIVYERVLAFGDRGDITYVGFEKLKTFFLTKHPPLDKKSHRFWEVISGSKIDNSTPSLYERINHPTSRRNFR